MNEIITILIAEDSLTQAAQLQYILSQKGYNVLYGENGKEALELANNNNPSIIVSDIVMPEMDGFQLCKHIKESQKTSHIPVILLTSLTNSEDVINGLDSGADGFINKPYSEDYLLAYIEKTLKKFESGRALHSNIELEIEQSGKKRSISVEPNRMLSLLISTYESAIQKNTELSKAQKELYDFNSRLEEIVSERTDAYVKEITARIQTEKELLIAKEKAEESDRLKTAFLENMSHEIRTPMNGIIGFASLLDNPELSSKTQREYIELISQGSKRMLNIINDIVNISKIESGTIPLYVQETNIKVQLEKLFSVLKKEAEAKGLEFKYDIKLSESEAIINTDEYKLVQIISNLIKNAIKFTEEGYIEVSCEQRSENIEFCVKDTGVGIAKEHYKMIFDRFRQISESSSRLYDGAGLGLAISNAFAKMLNGKIWFESEIGKGSSFYFAMPLKMELQ